MLVVAQVALSLVSLVAAGRVPASLGNAQRTETGFETRRRAGHELQPRARRLHAGARTAVLRAGGRARRRAFPGSSRPRSRRSPPLAGGLLPQRLSRGPGHDDARPHARAGQLGGAGYFDAIGIPLVTGRDFHARRTRPRRRSSRSSTKRWRTSSGPARTPSASGSSSSAIEDHTTIVGVAKNSKYNGVAEEPIAVHLPAAGAELHAAGDAARPRRPATPRSLAAGVRHAVQQIDPTLSVFNVRTLEDQVCDSLAAAADQRHRAWARSASSRCCSRRSASTASPATR